MRIAYVCVDRGVPVFGRKGCSIHVQEVVRGFRRAGAEVVLFAARAGGPPPPDLADVKVCALEAFAVKGGPGREQAAISANPLLAECLHREGRFDFVYERHSLWSYAAMRYARECDTPGVLEVNAPLIEEQARFRELVRLSAATDAVDRAFRSTDAFIAVSDEIAAYIRRHPGISGSVHVVPNGVDPARFETPPAIERDREPGAFTIGFVGSLKPWHGLEVLLAAFAEVHRAAGDARLVLVGDGPERERLDAEAERHGITGAVQFTGAVDASAIPALVATFDVAVAPYPPMENFYFSPLKVFEYMAARRPVVASRIGQICDIIEDGTTGLLCEPGDPGDLARALLRLRHDAPLRDRLGAAARRQVLRHHTWEVAVDRILRIATSRNHLARNDVASAAERAG